MGWLIRLNRSLSPVWMIAIFCVGSHAAERTAGRPVKGSNYVLAEQRFRLPESSEVAIKLTASAYGASWALKGSEAAVVSIAIDGEHNQDVVLFAGSKPFVYRALLGRFEKGAHEVRLDLNRELSSETSGAVLISRLRIIPLRTRNAVTLTALEHAPLLYARPNTIGRFNDTPLLAWYEASRAGSTLTIRYSFVFSNEDGGTETEALMARWGRTTDIEWAYEVKLNRGRILEEHYQGLDHKTLPFGGQKAAAHPLLLIASDNNNFADQGQSRMRFALWPEPMNLNGHSREEIMDRHRWSYRVMSEELEREGKTSEGGEHGIRDPRQYIYVEAFAEREKLGAELVLRLRDGRTANSSLGRENLLIGRSGWFRAAAPLPSGGSWKDITGAWVACVDSTPCADVKVRRLFRLDEKFIPRSFVVKRKTNPRAS